MRAKLICEAKRLVRDKRPGKPRLRTEVIPPGTVIEGPKVYVLCLQGMAVPEDAECRRKVPMTDDEIGAAAHAYELVSKGIQPDDYDAYERGLMDGYKPKEKQREDRFDTWNPGKNWHEGCEREYCQDLEDDGEEDETDDE